MDVLTNLIVVIIPQYIFISKHCIVHLRHTQCFMSVVSQSSWEGKEPLGVWQVLQCGILLLSG